MAKNYEIADDSDKNRPGVLYRGEIESGGEERNYKNIVRLPNDVSENEENTDSYIKINGEYFTEAWNALSISCWINFIGTTKSSTNIITHTNTENKRFGLIANPNGNEYGIGYAWNMSPDESDFDFGINIEKDSWTHLVLILYKNGISRLFVDGEYKATHDQGYIRTSEVFNNIEIGRFSGLLDNVRLFSDTLDYGNVKLKQDAKNDVMYLYQENRTDFVPKIPKESDYIKRVNNNFITTNQGLKFKYKQDENYVKAHISYLNNTLKVASETGQHINKIIAQQSSEIQDEQKFTVKGGQNDGLRKFASGTFRTIQGEIVNSN